MLIDTVSLDLKRNCKAKWQQICVKYRWCFVNVNLRDRQFASQGLFPTELKCSAYFIYAPKVI